MGGNVRCAWGLCHGDGDRWSDRRWRVSKLPTLSSGSRGGSRGALLFGALAIVAALLAARYFDAPPLLPTARAPHPRVAPAGPRPVRAVHRAATRAALPG